MHFGVRRLTGLVALLDLVPKRRKSLAEIGEDCKYLAFTGYTRKHVAEVVVDLRPCVARSRSYQGILDRRAWPRPRLALFPAQAHELRVCDEVGHQGPHVTVEAADDKHLDFHQLLG